MKYIKPHQSLAARMLGDEMVVMSLRDSKVYSLNATASVIWNAADGATPLDEIAVARLVPEFEVDAETAKRDALELAEALALEGILTISDEPIGEATK